MGVQRAEGRFLPHIQGSTLKKSMIFGVVMKEGRDLLCVFSVL